MKTTDVQTLVDTGAGPSCISEHLMISNPSLGHLRIRRCEKRAYSVNGAPVVTLGIVDIEFKINGASYTHTFIILRGLIHPLLLGLDFLMKYKANIHFDEIPGLTLKHPVLKQVEVNFIKPAAKPPTNSFVSLLNDVSIPPRSICYTDAFVSNVDNISSLVSEKPDRVLGITAIQKEEPEFDPGFILRDAVINAGDAKFTVELLNPSDFDLKIEAGTPLGAIIDYDCELMDTNGTENDLFSEKTTNQTEVLLQQQTLMSANINLIESNPQMPTHRESPSKNPDQRPLVKDPMEWPQPRPPPTINAVSVEKPPSAKMPTPIDETVKSKNPDRRPAVKDPMEWPQPRPPPMDQDIQTQPITEMDTEAYKNQPPANQFTKPFEDEREEVKFTHKMKAEEINKDNKDFIVNLSGCDAINDQQKTQLEDLINKHPRAFSKHQMDIGCTNLVYHHVKMTDTQPIYTAYHKVQEPEIRKVIDEQTQGLLAAGVLKESESPFCAPMIMVRKKLGGWRYCVDLRRINKKTDKITFPLPKIEDSMRRLKNPKIFSSLDLLKAYYQIPVVEGHQKYYAYSDGRRHLQWARCPMGAKNSGSSLALLMELVLRGLPPECIIGYLDDILIATEDWETHIKILEKLLKALEHAGLKLCPGKCHFARQEVKTLGYSLSGSGIRPDQYNLDKVEKWTELNDKSQVRTFLGLTGYYRSIIKNYANIAAPLSDLLHDNKEWTWGDREKSAFNKLKTILTSEPVAAYPDYDKPFILKTDASKVAMGAVLCQIIDGKERMIACTSKKFTSDELKWIPYDREYYAVVFAVKHFAHYLRFKPFTIITDHKPLLAWRDVATQQDGHNKRTRWAMMLSTFDFEMIYRQGKRHSDADALSRHPDPDEPDPPSDDEIISTINLDSLPVFNLAAASYQTELGLVEIHCNESATKEMREHQAGDEQISKAIELVKRKETNVEEWRVLPNWFLQNRHGFIVNNDVLYHYKNFSPLDQPISRVVIPESKRHEILFKAHGHMQSGHPSSQRTLTRLERFATWPGMISETINYVKRCAECQAVRVHIPTKAAPVLAQEATRPLEYVQADLYYVGKAYNKMEYVLVIEDRATKHCRLFALRDAKATSVATCLEQYVSLMGCPERWGTDGGREFMDKLILAMCKALAIKKEFALAYRPQTQGQTERKNRTIKAELKKRCHQFGPNWPAMLKWIEFSYNTTTHPSHGFTPYKLMFSQDPRLPVTQDLPQFNSKGWETSMKTYFQDFLERITQWRELAAERKQAYLAKIAASHDQRPLTPLLPGQQVLRKIPDQYVGKIDLPKDGPWLVLEQRVKDGQPLPVYVIKDNNGNTLLSHRDNLSPYLEPVLKENEDENPPTPEKPNTPKSIKKPDRTTDCPAARTRSKSKQILTLIRPKKANNPPPPPPPPLPLPPAVQYRYAHRPGGESEDDDDNGDDNNGGAEYTDDEDENLIMVDGDRISENNSQGDEHQNDESEEESDSPDNTIIEDESTTSSRLNTAGFLSTPELSSVDGTPANARRAALPNETDDEYESANSDDNSTETLTQMRAAKLISPVAPPVFSPPEPQPQRRAKTTTSTPTVNDQAAAMSHNIYEDGQMSEIVVSKTGALVIPRRSQRNKYPEKM